MQKCRSPVWAAYAVAVSAYGTSLNNTPTPRSGSGPPHHPTQRERLAKSLSPPSRHPTLPGPPPHTTHSRCMFTKRALSSPTRHSIILPLIILPIQPSTNPTIHQSNHPPIQPSTNPTESASIRPNQTKNKTTSPPLPNAPSRPLILPPTILFTRA